MTRAVFVSLAVLATANPALGFDCPAPKHDGSDEANAKQAFESAVQLESSDPDAALERLDCAELLFPRPVIALRIGSLAEKRKNWSRAADAYERYLRMSGDSAPDRVQMEERIRVLRERAARYSSQDPNATPQIRAPGRRADPGTRGSTLPGWVLVGSGAALAVVGGLFLLSAKNKSDEVHDVSPDSNTAWKSSDGEDRLDAAKRDQLIGLIGLGLGAVAGGAGAYLLLTPPQSNQSGWSLSYSGRF